jgi:hypothetical protein
LFSVRLADISFSFERCISFSVLASASSRFSPDQKKAQLPILSIAFSTFTSAQQTLSPANVL